jgi:NAD-specific glutamate dehydrogenase
MNKRIIGILLTLVVATQVFPVDGFRFWSNLVQSKALATTATILALEEEEVEEIQFKVKNMESNHSMYFESQMASMLLSANYPIMTHLGAVIDRNNPILIPPPNTIIEVI